MAESGRGLSVRPLIVDLGRDYRGGQHQALLLVEGLLRRGHAPELMALADSLLARRAREAGAKVHEIPIEWRRTAATQRIARLARRRAFDLLHANEPHALTCAWIARAHKAAPMVAARRVALPLARGKLSLDRYRAASCVIAVSRCVEKFVLGAGVPLERVRVIYDGVTIPPEISASERAAARGPLAIPPDALCIGCAAALVPQKGHALLLRAFAEARRDCSGAVLLLWGEGPELSNLEKLAAELGVLAAVRFAGTKISFESAYAAMDIFAFASHMEALGSALLAAMARGIPVVAFARDGMTEAVQHNTNGLLVEPLDAGAFAAALHQLMSHPEAARELGRAARKTVVARFSADRMVEETLRLYEEVLG